MTTLTLALAGCGIGLGLALVIGALAPARPRLTDALAAPHRAPAPAPARPSNLVQAAGAPAVGPLAALGLPQASTRADLTALDRSTETHLAQQAGLTLIAAIAGPLYALGLALIGVRIPVLALVLGTLVLAAIGFAVPGRLVHNDAVRLREQLRYATSALLDLVSVMLAAGAGQEQAFTLASQTGTGTGTGHDLLRAALGAARTTRTPIWDELGALGRKTGVPELTELAATSQLAGTEGATIRATLVTKAASLRARLLAAAEAKAASATERMGMPTVLLMIGFLIFTCYPALAQVLKSL